MAALALKVTNLWNCKVGHGGISASLDISPWPSRSCSQVWCWPEIWRYVKCDILLQRSNQGRWRGIVGEIKHVASMQGVANWLRASGSHLWLCSIIFLLFVGNFRVCKGKNWHWAMCDKVWIGKVYASGLSSPKGTLLGFWSVNLSNEFSEEETFGIIKWISIVCIPLPHYNRIDSQEVVSGKCWLNRCWSQWLRGIPQWVDIN